MGVRISAVTPSRRARVDINRHFTIAKIGDAMRQLGF